VGAGRMMPPGFILYELTQLLRSIAIRSWFKFFADEVRQLLVHLADKLYTFYHRIQVFALSVISLLEIVELDQGCVLRLVRFQTDTSSGVICMGLENGPGKAIMETLCLLGISLAVAGKISGQAEDIKIRLRLVWGGFLDDAYK